MWADNIFFVSPLHQATAEARLIRDTLKPIGLDINNNETVAYVPNASSITSLLDQFPDFPVKLELN